MQSPARPSAGPTVGSEQSLRKRSHGFASRMHKIKTTGAGRQSYGPGHFGCCHALVHALTRVDEGGIWVVGLLGLDGVIQERCMQLAGPLMRRPGL